MSKNLDFEAFVAKAMKRQEEINKPFELEVSGYGLITFNKPKNSQLLKYIDSVSNAVETDGDDENAKVISQDLVSMDEASRELVYFACPFLQQQELHEKLEIKDPLQTPSIVFGINETMRLAAEISKRAEGEKVAAKVDETIKN